MMMDRNSTLGRLISRAGARPIAVTSLAANRFFIPILTPTSFMVRLSPRRADPRITSGGGLRFDAHI